MIEQNAKIAKEDEKMNSPNIDAQIYIIYLLTVEKEFALNW